MRTKDWLLIAGVLFVCAWLFWYFKYDEHHMRLQREKVPDNFWGVTFSKKYADELGIDWREAYIGMLDDLRVRKVRLPVYWDEVERDKDKFDFTDYDWMIEEGNKRDVQFIVVIGRRLPRWPECHQPAWTDGLPEEVMDQRHVYAALTIFRHFKSHSSIAAWQVENEYFFPLFGECPEANPGLIQYELRQIREEDNRPIVLTDSGELNSWRTAAKYSDVLGVTMYRVTWNNYLGYIHMPWPAWVYRLKAKMAGETPATTFVAELQAEPWPANFQKVQDASKHEQFKSFNIRQFETNAELARRTRFGAAYLWGVEWWWWLKQQGDARMWNFAKTLFIR